MTKINIGIVGSVGRGKSFKQGFIANNVHIKAVCDLQENKLEESRELLGADEKYTDYAEMLEKANLDAVVIATPMHLHAQQAILALQKNINVMSEVTAAVSMDECMALVEACKKSKGIYMMSENYCYTKPNMIIKHLAEQNLFGKIYYAEGEYIHEVKALNEETVWRRKWQTGIDGITYGTHSLGPILTWMQDDRVVSVCCEGSGSNHKDPRGNDYAQDSCVMLCKTAKGALIKIRVDMLSDRPHAMMNYQLQ
jgi:predicted dehydrogenase